MRFKNFGHIKDEGFYLRMTAEIGMTVLEISWCIFCDCMLPEVLILISFSEGVIAYMYIYVYMYSVNAQSMV